MSGIKWSGSPDVNVTGLSYDSRKVKKGDLYFAIKGHQVDGHGFLGDAYEKGAVAAIVEDEKLEKITQIKVSSVMKSMADISNQFFDEPSQKIPVIGVTGTNGKTTITYLIEKLLKEMGKDCGVMGTINYRIGTESFPAPNTTPMSVDVNAFLARNIEAKSDAVIMEVSSHALVLDRVNHVRFKVGVFTNLTQDHLDFHKDMEDYYLAKKKLFEVPLIKSVINLDDSYGRRLFGEIQGAVGFGQHPQASLRAEDCRLSLKGIQFNLVFPSKNTYAISNNLMGQHNISNALAAAGALLAMGFEEKEIVRGLNKNHHIPGRLERIEEGQEFVVAVDYAHTHDALSQVLKALRETGPKRLLCLFGAGGDRDRTKRPKMGQVAVEQADFVYVTSDNPRTEDPQKIIRDIEAGIQKSGQKNYIIIPDRKQAIQKMISDAQSGDALLIAGKGHEDYQIIGTQKFHFSDQEIAREMLQ